MAITQGIPGLTLDSETADPDDIPRVPTELLEALEVRFPNICPELHLSPLDYGVVHGQLNVVRLLREWHDRPSVTTKDSL